jgi:hypothetical protein
MARSRMILLAVLAASTIVGCKDFNGPRKAAMKPKPDLPGYSIEEQQRRGRDKLTIPEDNFRIGPSLNIDRPSPTGR